MRIFIYSVFVIALTGLAFGVDDESLVFFCPFEEGGGDVAVDVVSGMEGRISGANWVEGKIGGALEFTASGSQVEFDPDPILDLKDSVTMEAWIKPNAVQADSAVMGRRTSANVGGYCMQWTNGKVETWIHVGGWQGTRDKQTITPDPGEWHHIAGVFTGSKVIQYVDGEVDTEFDLSGKIGSVEESFRIGSAQTGLTSMIGLIDEVAIYNRGLTAEEIKKDMNEGVIPAPVSPKDKVAAIWGQIKMRY